jgi:hypothetical protein
MNGLTIPLAKLLAIDPWTNHRNHTARSPSAAMLRSDVSESAAPFRDQQTASAQWDCWNPSSLMQRQGQSIWKATPIRLEVYNELAFRCIHHSCQKYTHDMHTNIHYIYICIYICIYIYNIHNIIDMSSKALLLL